MRDNIIAPEHCTEQAATALAKRIERWWHERGYLGVKAYPTHAVSSDDTNSRKPVFGVRSNLGLYLPRKATI